ncbi:prolipoprotein diacylglyceryl transferase family protein [Spiroplasma culicicola]|uniref:Prolipoprotein diacylglyceryl transferase n=1 Tax=Spiroplasma culicicola AES-1 TaxID=1276246 RepID=W6A6E3_9MOLU|nr:prolipoprotein diacylglyceryl transferase family protein [Spiroplasma culicicola]AHI52420.1 prolipoprotein diacylglyceryl transferase [Spiroplasma culicicola AES-1]
MINFLATDNPIYDAEADWLSFMYPILLTIGAFLVIAASTTQLVMRKIPLKDFMNAIYIVIPLGVLGGSIFGKLGTGVPFYEIFYIWEPGMSFFGAFVAGFAGGFAWLWSRKGNTKISIWTYADCIVPNVLLGQSIGRWGNLFNHEIMGKATDIEKWKWLPDWMWQRFFYYIDPSNPYDQNGNPIFIPLEYREPLFLYESIATLMAWVLIVFIIPLIFKAISKKPWQIAPLTFPVNKAIAFDDIQNLTTYIEIYYKSVESANGEELYYMSKRQAWLKAYFAYEADLKQAEILQEQIDLHKQSWEKNKEKYLSSKYKLNEKIELLNTKLKKEQIDKKQYKQEIKILKSEFKQATASLIKNKSRFTNWLTLDSSELYKLNNPQNYKVMHSGVMASTYFVIYCIIRIILDSFRSNYELAFKWSPVMNYISISLMLLLGILILICAQWIAPKKWREEGWLYEKSY